MRIIDLPITTREGIRQLYENIDCLDLLFDLQAEKPLIAVYKTNGDEIECYVREAGGGTLFYCYLTKEKARCLELLKGYAPVFY